MEYILPMKTISIRITNSQYERIQERVEKLEISMSEQIRRAIENYLIIYERSRNLVINKNIDD